MTYLVALAFPPLACLMVGRFGAFLLNLLLCITLIGIPIAIIHARITVSSFYEINSRQRNSITIVNRAR